MSVTHTAAEVILAAAEKSGLLREVAEALCTFDQRIMPTSASARAAEGLCRALASEFVDICTPGVVLECDFGEGFTPICSDADLAPYLERQAGGHWPGSIDEGKMALSGRTPVGRGADNAFIVRRCPLSPLRRCPRCPDMSGVLSARSFVELYPRKLEPDRRTRRRRQTRQKLIHFCRATAVREGRVLKTKASPRTPRIMARTTSTTL